MLVWLCSASKPFSSFFHLKDSEAKEGFRKYVNYPRSSVGPLQVNFTCSDFGNWWGTKSGLVTTRSAQLWGSPAGILAWQYSLGLMYCPLSPTEAQMWVEAARHCLSPAMQTLGGEFGEPQLRLPTTFQGCLLIVYCLEWKYSTHSFAATSLRGLPTSLALAQLCEQHDVSQIDREIHPTLGKKKPKPSGETPVFLTVELLTWVVSQSRSVQGHMNSGASTSRGQNTMIQGWEWQESLGVGRICQWHLKIVNMGPQPYTHTHQTEVEENEFQPFHIFMSCSEHKTFY